MKTFKLIALASGISIVMMGCATTDVPVEDIDKTETPVVDEVVSFQDKIEDFSGYELVTDPSITSFVPTCDGYSQEFAQKVDDGEIKRLLLYGGGDYALDVMMTPNYDNWTEADFDKVNSCGELGSVLAVKVVGDSLLWSYPHCTAGVAPNNADPGYKYFTECEAVATELNEYLAQ